MVVQSNSGIDSLIRCSAIKLISKIQSSQEIELYSLILQCMAVYRECFVIDNTRQTLSQREEQQVIMLFSSELEICYKALNQAVICHTCYMVQYGCTAYHSLVYLSLRLSYLNFRLSLIKPRQHKVGILSRHSSPSYKPIDEQ